MDVEVGGVLKKISLLCFSVLPGLHHVWTEENYESPVGITICSRTEDSTSGECTHLNRCPLSDH